jgi:hypothetical protein
MVNGPDDVYVEREGQIATVAGPEHDSDRCDRPSSAISLIGEPRGPIFEFGSIQGDRAPSRRRSFAAKKEQPKEGQERLFGII